MRFIHTADWQIGLKAAHVAVAAQRVREERLEAARRVVQAAKDNGAQFVVVAGDTFEDNAVDRILIQRVADILSEFDGPVYLIPGNHDPWVPGSVWEHPAWASCDKLHILLRAEPTEVPGGVLYPCPACDKHSRSDPTSWVQASGSQEVAVGVAHGTVEGVPQDEPDYPIPLDARTRTGLDYLALGHWHSRTEYPDSAGATGMAYCGTHEATKFGERESGNALLVDIAKRGAPPVVSVIRVGGLHWELIEEETRQKGDLPRLLKRVEGLQEPRSTLVQVRIKGVVFAEDAECLSHLRQIIESRFLVGELDTSGLFASPQDSSWIEGLPVGVLREAGNRLRQLSDPTYVGQRPEGASPEVASQALLQLYALARGTL